MSSGALRQPALLWRQWRTAGRRSRLWTLLVVLVFAMLATLVWLAGRYERSQLQQRVERDAADAAADLRGALDHDVQGLHALLPAARPHGDRAWDDAQAGAFLRSHRALLRLERRDDAFALLAQADTPYRNPVLGAAAPAHRSADLALVCANARRSGSAVWSRSFFVQQPDSRGLEVIDVCLPLSESDRTRPQAGGYLIASYSLRGMLAELIGPQLTRGQEISLNEPDGTRLAVLANNRRGVGGSLVSARQLLQLPGSALVLRIDAWRDVPDLFPNVMTALVTGMSIALVTVLVLLGKDIRRRQRVEADLAEALAFRKAMENSLVTGLRARDLDGRVRYVNPAFCEMVGWSADELLQADGVPPYWPPDLAAGYLQRQRTRAAGQAPPRAGFESTYLRRDGSRFPVLIFEAPLVNAQGLQTGWMSAVLDVSEQRRVEEISRASQERLQATARLAAVGEMASLLSHELNQPLAAISSYATGSLNLLQQHRQRPPASGPEELAQAMRLIAAQAERAGQVIKSVHDFVRRRDQKHEAVTPRALLDAVLPLVALQARKLQVRLQVEADPGLPPVRCDRTMVEQVLLNLARNGMQAMDQPDVHEDDRLLCIAARLQHDAGQGARLECSVADRGCGIAPAVRERLFTPFFTTRPEGMGLGLSLCRTVVEQHGGVLGFAPQQPRGTVFWFTLPL